MSAHDDHDTLIADTLPGEAEARPKRARGLQLEKGTALGRYVILQKLGAGGMGVVYAAYDPELDRKVAIKLLLPGGSGASASIGRSRLVREAQAMAKLDHPNVVTVHDVGQHDGAVYMAMEFVDGGTLGAWLERSPRSWPEILETMTLAGKGLEAAHAAGLVHRDFKPENVMVGSDGRVRVMDFGLVRADESTTSDASPSGAEVPRGDGRTTVGGSALDSKLTLDGGIMGTPAYMAPEQFAGDETDARSDQFSFSVALWEALHGERPFAGESIAALSFALAEGRIRDPKRSGVPRWLTAATQRGLARDPGARYPNMRAMLAALQSGHRKTVWKRVGIGSAVLLGLAGAGYGAFEYDTRERVAGCEAKAASRDSTWNDAARSRVREALEGNAVPYAKPTADKTIAWLDRQADDLASARVEICMNSTVTQSWTEEISEQGSWCLTEREMEFETLIGLFEDADITLLNSSIRAAAKLKPVDRCTDPRHLATLPTPPEASRGAYLGHYEALARAGHQLVVGRHEEATEATEGVLAAPEVAEWPPLHARAKFSLASSWEKRGEYEKAEDYLEEAYFEAAHAGAREIAESSAAMLSYVVGYRQARHDEGLRWAAHGELQARLADADGGLRRANRLNNVGAIHNSRGDYERGRALHEEALAIRESVLGPEHPNVALSLVNMASAHARAGDLDEARRVSERSVVITEAALGPEHPDLGRALINLAGTHFVAGRFDEAEPLFERALKITEGALGPDHPAVATSLNNLAAVHDAKGELDRAKPLFERALAIREAALDPGHPNLATSMGNLGLIHIHEGEFAKAKGLLERALVIKEASLGADHPSLVHTLTNLSRAEFELGEPGPALEHAERSLAICEANDANEEQFAETRLAVARALWAGDGDRTRARELAEQSLEAYRTIEGSEDSIADVEAWLATHRSR
jgi:tetratricopeptide (TPR) repeat protein